jgi:hypothetical protein
MDGLGRIGIIVRAGPCLLLLLQQMLLLENSRG